MTAVLVLSTGLYALALRVLVESFAVLPVGGDLPVERGAESVVQAVAESLALALRLASPLVLTSMRGNFAQGLLAWLAP